MDFIKEYVVEEYQRLNEIDQQDFQNIIDLFVEAYQNDRQIFLIGNGGSAATCNHFAGDLSKNAISCPDKKRFRIISLAQSPEMITMYGNDVSFEDIFTEQLKNLLCPEDLLISVSASASSPDLISAIQYARKKKAKIISLAGFNGGKIKSIEDCGISINSEVYEIIEDLHLIIFHMIVSYFKKFPDVLDKF